MAKTLSAYVKVSREDARGVSVVSHRGAGPIGKIGHSGDRYWPMTMDEQHLSGAKGSRREAVLAVVGHDVATEVREKFGSARTKDRAARRRGER